jgi:hypothetical protein
VKTKLEKVNTTGLPPVKRFLFSHVATLFTLLLQEGKVSWGHLYLWTFTFFLGKCSMVSLRGLLFQIYSKNDCNQINHFRASLAGPQKRQRWNNCYCTCFSKKSIRKICKTIHFLTVNSKQTASVRGEITVSWTPKSNGSTRIEDFAARRLDFIKTSIQKMRTADWRFPDGSPRLLTRRCNCTIEIEARHNGCG